MNPHFYIAFAENVPPPPPIIQRQQYFPFLLTVFLLSWQWGGGEGVKGDDGKI
jgi:hypothetical protein